MHVTLAVVDALIVAEELGEDDAEAGGSSKGNAIESWRALEP